MMKWAYQVKESSEGMSDPLIYYKMKIKVAFRWVTIEKERWHGDHIQRTERTRAWAPRRVQNKGCDWRMQSQSTQRRPKLIRNEWNNVRLLILHSRPGILVLVNETDWDLLEREEATLQNNDTVAFISTLHGGWRTEDNLNSLILFSKQEINSRKWNLL